MWNPASGVVRFVSTNTVLRPKPWPGHQPMFFPVPPNPRVAWCPSAGTPTTRHGRLRSRECIPPGHACLLGVMGWRLASFALPSTTSDNHHPPPFRTVCDSPTAHPGGARRTPNNLWTWVGTTQLATTDRATASTCPSTNFRWANPTRLATTRGSPYQHSRTGRHSQQPRPRPLEPRRHEFH